MSECQVQDLCGVRSFMIITYLPFQPRVDIPPIPLEEQYYT